MTLDEVTQRQWKRRLVRDALERIGGFTSPPVEPVRVVSSGMGYRNKVEFSLESDPAGRTLVGLHRRDASRGVVDVEACAVQHEQADEVLATARRFLREVPGMRWEKGEGAGPRLVIRRSRATGDILVVLREGDRPFPQARRLARCLADAHPRIGGVVRVKGPAGGGEAASVKRLVGRSWLEERVGGIELRLPATAFFQINGEGAWRLVELVAECAGDVRAASVLDLYGGVGLYSLELIRRGASHAVVCDTDRDAITCGREASRRAGESRIEHRQTEVGRYLAGLSPGETVPNLIVANPPRRGLGASVRRALAALPVPRMVIVSCDPPTLGRDLRYLHGHGYCIERIVPVDLFPQTPHVETVVALRGERAS
jgi:23S rRNA (uracil1939-C5)-methyltransferase